MDIAELEVGSVDQAGLSEAALPAGSMSEDSLAKHEHPPQGARARGTLVGAAALATTLAACGEEGSIVLPGAVVGTTPLLTVDKLDGARFLLQASLSASTGAITELNSEGYERWLDRQIAAPIEQTARQFFASRGYDRVDTNRYYNSGNTGNFMIWSQLLSGGNSVRTRVAFALSEFFVVSLTGINLVWPSPAIGEYWDILNRHAFGNFRDLLQDITLNPAMGVFLNTRGNRRADPATGRLPDENYAREVMQLFTIGLLELNPDGTPRMDNGRPVETYTSADVSGLARVFTGYDFDFSGIAFSTEIDGTRQIPDPAYTRRPMTSDPSRWQFPRTTGFHSPEAKTFLGLTIPAGTDATQSLRLALDHLFAHPNVGPFFARQMIQRLVTSNPSPAYVRRVADVFANNGQGRRGDLAAVFRAILLDTEARDLANVTNANFGKLREPVLRFAQLARTFGARSVSGNWQIGDLSDAATGLGQSPLRSPSVFNFFRPGYFPASTEIANRGLLAPEFQLVNETSVAGYINFLERAVQGGRSPVSDITMDYAAMVDIALESGTLLDRLDLLLTGNQLSQGAKDTIRTAMDSVALTATSSNADRLRRVQIGVTLVLASTDYLIQK
jgi:uncharacterized protein (DUF1800 family)